MGVPLTVVLLEDSLPDAELIIRALRKAGYELKSTRVTTEEEFTAALASEPDIILSDSSLPVFSMSRALAVLQARGLNVPVIAVTGKAGDEDAAECIRVGAVDHVSKDDLARLPEAIQQAIGKKAG
jgi:CheY-like chemotaxis protein